jgi:hypothetical protein
VADHNAGRSRRADAHIWPAKEVSAGAADHVLPHPHAGPVVADRHGGASGSHRGCFVKGVPARVWRGFRHVAELRARAADLAQII